MTNETNIIGTIYINRKGTEKTYFPRDQKIIYLKVNIFFQKLHEKKKNLHITDETRGTHSRHGLT